MNFGAHYVWGNRRNKRRGVGGLTFGFGWLIIWGSESVATLNDRIIHCHGGSYWFAVIDDGGMPRQLSAHWLEVERLQFGCSDSASALGES